MFVTQAMPAHTEMSPLIPFVPRVVLNWPSGDVEYRVAEGSVVFVDLSGFTALSEKLASRGKAGTEELTETLNETFSQLLADAYKAGGSLLKFGGDALLLWFDGTEHPRRAVFAADRMMRHLRTAGDLRTSVGRVRLGMTAGVHTGEFVMVLAGESHRELMLVGPDATKVVELEGEAGTGQIVVSRQIADRVEGIELEGEKGPGLLLKRAPGVEDLVDEFEGTPEGVDPSRFVPPQIAEHILGGGSDPEHRLITIAFVHFDGTDEIHTAHGPQELATRLSSVVKTVQASAARHSVTLIGSDIDHDGGKLILVAGAPRATGTDEERMLLALREILDGALPIPLRVGVNRGHAFTGAVGPGYRRTYTVMGDVVNTAARVMAKAQPGQILATREALDPSSLLFDAQEMEPFAAKGKRDPIQSWSLGPLIGRRQVDEDAPFVGRRAELQEVNDAVARGLSGQGVLIDLRGDPGIGKSRLLNEIKLGCPAQTLTVDNEEFLSGTPYRTAGLLLSRVLGLPNNPSSADLSVALQDHPDLEPWAPLIGTVLDIQVPATEEVAQLSEDARATRVKEVYSLALKTFLRSPVMLALEDLHWMDESSFELLDYTFSNVADMPWAVVVTSRPTDRMFGNQALIRVDLHPLSDEEGTAVARAIAGGKLLPQQMMALVHNAGGNPLFIQKLAALRAQDPSREDLPDTVESAIGARIDSLDPRDRTALRYASVLGSRGDLSLLMRLLDEELGRIDLKKPVLTEFLTMDERGEVRFRQNLFQQVAYEGLSFRRRRALHGKIGLLMEQEDPDGVEALSLHFYRSGDHDRAFTYGVKAARRAEARMAHFEACAFFETALTSSRQLGSIETTELSQLWEDFGQSLVLAGRIAEAPKAYRHARDLASDPERTGHLFFLEARARENLGRYPDALRWATRGLKVIGTPTGKLGIESASRLKAMHATIRFRQSRYREAIREAEAALDLAQRIDFRQGIGNAYNILHLSYLELGDERSETFGLRALEIYEALGNKRHVGNLLNNLGYYAYAQSRWDQASDLYRRSAEAFEASGHVIAGLGVSTNAAGILSDQGHWQQAESVLLRTLDAFKAANHQWVAEVTMSLGRLRARSGRFDEAADSYLQALELFEQRGVTGGAIVVYQAELELFRRDPAAALNILDRNTGLIKGRLRVLERLVRGCALRDLDDKQGAAISLEEGVQLAVASDSQFEAAIMQRVLSAIVTEGAEELEQQAQNTLDGLGVVRLPEYFS